MNQITQEVDAQRGLYDVRKVLVFANPVAGRGRAGHTAETIVRALRGAGLDPVEVYTPPAESCLPEGPFRAAVSIGGDGTLRSVVSRLVTPRDRPVTPRAVDDPWVDPPPILVVPMGTANLMHQSLGLPKRPRDLGQHVVEVVSAGAVSPRDVAVANGEIFLIVAGVGLDGQVIHELARIRTGPITVWSYVWPTAHSLLDWKFPAIEVIADGERVFGPSRGMAMVGNVREHGLGFSFLSRAVPHDGLMDLLAFKCGSVPQAVERFLQTATDRLVGAEGVVYLRVRRVEIRAAEPVPVQADGEVAGFTPLTVELLPRQIQFLTLPPKAT